MARRRAPTPTPLSEEECCGEPTETTAEGSCAGTSPSSSSRTPPARGAAAYEFSAKALGVGGSASVRLARPRAGGPCVAVKALRKESHSARRLAKNEAEIMRTLDHPGICKLLDTFEDEDHLYLVLEYVDGHELFEEVASPTPMGERRAAAIVRQLLAALQHCHARGVVHRDLKPENVLVADRPGGAGPAVTLVDFGLAARKGQHLSGISGTRPYLAPETLAGAGTCSAAVDMWSAGVVLYTCLFGDLPPAAVRSGSLPVLRADVWRGAGVSAGARALLAGLLEPEADRRLTAAEALQHPWLRVSAPASAPAAGEAHAGERIFQWAAAASAAPASGELEALRGCVEGALEVLEVCSDGRALAGEWLAWLGAAVGEDGKDTARPPSPLPYNVFAGCCPAQKQEPRDEVEVVVPDATCSTGL